MAENPNEALVRRGYQAFSSGDMATLAEVMSPDVVHKAAGDSAMSGDYKGRDEVFGFYGQLNALTDGTFRLELESVQPDGDDKVVARHLTTAQRNGKSISAVQTLVFTVRNGQVLLVEESSDDQAAIDAFWD